MIADLKPCPKCGDGSSEHGCDFCIGETGAEASYDRLVIKGVEYIPWSKATASVTHLNQQIAAANEEIADLKAWRNQDMDYRKELDELIDALKPTMAQMAEALDAVDRSNADGGFMFEVSEALDAYRKLMGEG